MKLDKPTTSLINAILMIVIVTAIGYAYQFSAHYFTQSVDQIYQQAVAAVIGVFAVSITYGLLGVAQIGLPKTD